MPPERRAVLVLLGLAVGGQALRVWFARPDAPPGEVALVPLPAGATPSPLAHRDSGAALLRPLTPGETINLDTASALEIARLPRIGLRLAKVIVADRQAHGRFGGLDGLDRVPGVGPGLLAAIRDHAAFASAAPAPVQDPGPARSAPTPDPAAPLDLNTATAAELERLPRIGPALALRIVAFRQTHGPFPVVDSLIRVPGIGPSTLARLRERLVVR